MPWHLKNYLALGLGSILIMIAVASRAISGDVLCAGCGRTGACQKVCRLVCEEKKVQVTCWGSQREDFCLPGPSRPGCRHCELVCDDNSDPNSVCSHSKRFIWTDWLPADCGKVFTKTKLMKRTVTKKVPSYKWVVEDLCADCESAREVADVPAGVQVPLPPVVDAKVLAPPSRPAQVRVAP